MENTEKKDKKFNKKKLILLIVAIALIASIIAGSIALIVYMNKQVKDDDNASDLVMAKGCSNFYYNCLTENQQKMYKMLYKQAENLLNSNDTKTTLGVYKYSDYGLNKNEAVDVWYAFRYDALSLFVISNTYMDGPDAIEVYVAPEFADKNNRERALSALESTVAEVGKLLEGLNDSAAKFKIIYDYVIDHTEYKRDENGQDIFDGYSYSIVGALDGDESTESICQGYAKAIAYLCNIFGLECLYVGSGSKNHALNVVKINDSWYYADSTKDDNNENMYKYFLNCQDLYWMGICKPSRNEYQDRLIAKVPILSSSNFDNIVKDENLNYRIINRTTCSVAKHKLEEKYTGDIVIPSKFAGMDVIAIDEEAFIFCSEVISVEIADSIASMGSRAFEGCRSLTRIVIPKSVTSISNSAFRDCSALSQVVFHDNVKRIGSDAFNGCRSLKNIELPKDLEFLGASAFSYCTSLESIEIPDAIESIFSEMFRGCSNLSRAVLPSETISIGEKAFFDCSNLANIEIPKSVGFIESEVFRNCNKLTIYCMAESLPSRWDERWNSDNRLVIWDRGKVQYGITDRGIHWCLTADGMMAVTGYSGLSSEVEIPSVINEISVTGILGLAFNYRKDLVSVDIPQSITFIGNRAFFNCGNMKIYCQVSEKPEGWDDNWNVSQTVMWNSSANDHGVTDDGFEWRLTDDGTIEIIGYNADATQLKIPSVIDGNRVSAIASINSRNLLRVEIPSSITIIKCDAFYNCSSLVLYCEAESKPSGWDNRWNWYCPVVWNCKYNDVADDGNVYYISDDKIVYVLNNGKATISMAESNVTSVVIPDNIVYKDDSYKVVIGDNAFKNCSSLTSVKISSGITSIGDYAFYGCSSLQSVEIPSSVTKIGSYAFAYCKIGEIWIPKSVEIMGANVFSYIFRVTTWVYCEVEEVPIGWDEDWDISYYDDYMKKYKRVVYILNSPKQ